MTPHKLSNLSRALQSLQVALVEPITEDRDLGGIVKAFECAYELAWTTLKSHLKEQGHDTQGARDVFRVAWRLGVLTGEDNRWVEMMTDRNLTVHTYDPAFARGLVQKIRDVYVLMLADLTVAMHAWPQN